MPQEVSNHYYRDVYIWYIYKKKDCSFHTNEDDNITSRIMKLRGVIGIYIRIESREDAQSADLFIRLTPTQSLLFLFSHSFSFSFKSLSSSLIFFSPFLFFSLFLSNSPPFVRKSLPYSEKIYIHTMLL